MSNAVTSAGVRAEDVVRAAGAGLIAAVLGGVLTVSLHAQPLESPTATALGAIVLAALMAALSYRHVGAMVSAGAVLAGLGVMQLFILQGDLLADDRLRGTRSVLESSTTFLLLGFLLLGAGAGWALARSLGQPRWAHYGVSKMVGALALGTLMGGLVLWSAGLLYVSDSLISWGIVPVIAGSALCFGAVLALSPTGMLPALVALGVTGFLSEDPFWGSPTMVIMVVLLAALVHFVGPREQGEADGRYSTENFNDWIASGRRDEDEAENSH